jgi:hypothetical protein
MQITVQIRTVYGVENVYPICDKAKSFARIARTKTLTLDTLHEVKALGYDIVNLPLISSAEKLFSHA